MKAVIQAAAGPAAGLGHVRRCLALAGALREAGGDVAFRLESVIGGASEASRLVGDAGFPSTPVSARDLRLPSADVLVVDTYDADRAFVANARACVPVVVAIEDLPDRDLPADIVVAVGSDAGQDRLRYPEATECLFGFPFALLDAEFAEPPPFRRLAIERVLITLGGADPRNATPMCMQWVAECLPHASQDVVIGPLFQDTRDIEMRAGALPCVSLRRSPSDRRGLMLGADVAIAGGGQTVVELAACATPTMAIALFDNQVRQLAALSRHGGALWVGGWDDPDVGDRVRAALTKLADPEARAAIGRTARQLIDGRGARRVAETIVDRLRKARR